MNAPAVTQERLREVLSYDPETGIFTWVSPPSVHPRLKGTPAGGNATGYTMIKIDGRKYKAHRLAWLYVYGSMPSQRIDHRDGNPFNNAIGNLREATQAQNCANAAKWAGKTLPKGVRLTRGDRFQARIRVDKNLITLGTFDTPAEAHLAYGEAARKFYGEFARLA